MLVNDITHSVKFDKVEKNPASLSLFRLIIREKITAGGSHHV